MPKDLCCCGTEQENTIHINPGAEFTTETDSSVGRALVMIADDAGSIPAQSTIFHDNLYPRRMGMCIVGSGSGSKGYCWVQKPKCQVSIIIGKIIDYVN